MKSAWRRKKWKLMRYNFRRRDIQTGDVLERAETSGIVQKIRKVHLSGGKMSEVGSSPPSPSSTVSSSDWLR